MFDTYKLCPHCGELMAWNSYFGSYICQSCGNDEMPHLKEVQDQNKKLKEVLQDILLCCNTSKSSINFYEAQIPTNLVEKALQVLKASN